ncbi:predicted protein [Naegleria gruberi]|uniref:Predicted protein n=1 Tax=Naegleria gruberi TaxID=5762 RepID=D2W056_NAEGR|nr:uncharacterized protein NAEGRDRAFT_74739 [Naegleria gruberi]EFC37557.1 predicted protein [Naegleria gruberi]|eukprot:XP_002670301.1 predicted protein [Naegleria gruberi strain NEG-M]
MSVKPGGKILCIDVAPITLSFISDIISTSGKVYCVNSSESDYQIVAKLQSQRNNLIAISGSANNPSEYQSEIPEKVDIIMTNGTHKAMTENAKLFLKEGGDFYIVLHKPEGYVQQSVEWTQETITDVKKYFKPRELLTLEPFSNTDAVFVGTSFCNVE